MRVDALGQRQRQQLRIAGAREAAHADMGTRRDQRSGISRGHDLGAKVGGEDAIGRDHLGASLGWWRGLKRLIGVL